MANINQNYQNLPASYLFSEIAHRVSEHQAAFPEARILRLGIGDVTLPLADVVIEAVHQAIEEQKSSSTFKGYAPEVGYAFLKETIAQKEYLDKGMAIQAGEIVISDGSKSDAANIQELFAAESIVAVGDPVYPVYVDSNVMAGRLQNYDPQTKHWQELIYLPMSPENHFVPALPDKVPDLIYLCYPNNPTGATITKEQLQKWVDYANLHGSIIIYDAAYERFIKDPDLPHSIYECEGARTCAIELRSFSKGAGFTGLRLAFTVIPDTLVRDGVKLLDMWVRRQGSKYNGAPYIVQKAGEAVYSERGQRETQEQIDYYMENARLIKEGLLSAGLKTYGGDNSPYIWIRTPDNMTSWEYFDYLLTKANVVGTPGVGFGPHGEGYFRLSAFAQRETVIQAIEEIKKISR